jgi:hypothetical protein
MPVTVELQDNNRIVIITWKHPVIQDDFMGAFALLEPIYRDAKLPVHCINLADQLHSLPPRAISTWLKDPRSPLVHPMAGVMIVVSTKAFIRAITHTTAQMRPAGKLLAAATFEEAVVKLEAMLKKEGES